jgi:hypothetical protein
MTKKVSVSILGIVTIGFSAFFYVNKDNAENVFIPAHEVKDSAKVDSCRIDSIVIDSIK